MSGHSKWAQIKRQKALVDAKRGKAFTKLARAISIAARRGSDPKLNTALQQAIDRALAANMPKDNIERAVRRGSGEDKALEFVLLEAYGPGGVGMIIEAQTDSRNRTVAELRHLLAAHSGSLGTAGSVMWQFDKEGHNFKAKQLVAVDDAAKTQLQQLIAELEERDDILKITTALAK
jgi:YebC/PmpR family DNA-binding regulatory protein